MGFFVYGKNSAHRSLYGGISWSVFLYHQFGAIDVRGMHRTYSLHVHPPSEWVLMGARPSDLEFQLRRAEFLPPISKSRDVVLAPSFAQPGRRIVL